MSGESHAETEPDTQAASQAETQADMFTDPGCVTPFLLLFASITESAEDQRRGLRSRTC